MIIINITVIILIINTGAEISQEACALCQVSWPSTRFFCLPPDLHLGRPPGAQCLAPSWCWPDGAKDDGIIREEKRAEPPQRWGWKEGQSCTGY